MQYFFCQNFPLIFRKKNLSLKLQTSLNVLHVLKKVKICFNIFKSRLLWMLLLSVSYGYNHLNAQEPVQTIRGRVYDQINFLPLEGASVTLAGTQPLKGTVTDSLGNFRLDKVETGRYRLLITHIGYQSKIMDIILNAGKETIVETGISEMVNPLDEVVVKADRSALRDPLEVTYLSSRQVTVDEAQRYAATFYDPARVVTATPGVMAVNDQANHLVVRGNNPNGMLWKIEGADVVNPNHLTNAGTFSDKPSLTGGGVTILNLQLLADSRFLNGAFAAGHGNALSGVFDVNLRKGNNQQYEFTAQASLLGLDFAVEGPLAKSYNGSFVLNYRYSTLGLFAKAGMPIGDETINFHDLSFNLSLPAGKAGNFTIFGFGGKSITVYEGLRDSSSWVYQKDRTDVDFYSDAGVIGFSHKLRINRNSGIHTAVAFSGLQSGRKEAYISSDYSLLFSERDRLLFTRNSWSVYYFNKVATAILFKAGATVNRDGFEIENDKASETHQTDVLHDGKAHYIVYQPFIHIQHNLVKDVQVDAGLHFLYSDFNRNLSVEPRISAKLNLSTGNIITAGYGLHSQMQHPAIYFNQVEANRQLAPSRAHHFIIGYTRWFGESLVLRSELYYQSLFDVPVSAGTASNFSAVNFTETGAVTEALSNRGTGRNYGVDVSLERSFRQSFYFILAGSLYESLYKGSDGVERSTRFNGNHHIKLTAGKEWDGRSRGDKKNIFGINSTLVQAGGYPWSLSWVSDGQTQERFAGDEPSSFSGRMNDFFRIDLRFLWRTNRKNYTRILALDVQNATNRKNPAWYYYDEQQQAMVVKNQLGLIPFLSYRVEF